MLDVSQSKHAHIDERLRSDLMIWLGTVRPDGRPHSVAVWFLWDGSQFLIFSQPKTQKIYNLRQNAQVVLSLDNTKDGSDVIIIEGKAELLKEINVDMTLPAFAQKYASELKGMGTTAEALAQDYSQGIRITPTKFVGL